MKVNQATHSVGMMCRLLQVSRSGFYAWLDTTDERSATQADMALTGEDRRDPPALARDVWLAEHPRRARGRSRDPRRAQARRAADARGGTARGDAAQYVVTTEGDAQARSVGGSGRAASSTPTAWIGCGWRTSPISPPGSGFLYLAMVLDVYSRKIVGWAMETHLRTELILAALNMAITQRRPKAVIHHSDRGCQYTSYAFGKRCREAGIMPSMGIGGRCVRQRDGGELFRHARARSAQPPSLQEPGRSEDGDL